MIPTAATLARWRMVVAAALPWSPGIGSGGRLRWDRE
jgi:hypothetical protein